MDDGRVFFPAAIAGLTGAFGLWLCAVAMMAGISPSPILFNLSLAVMVVSVAVITVDVVVATIRERR